jgi:hypothetical protein
MADLTAIEKRKLERLFDMDGGYVMNFSNRTLEEFVMDSVGLSIYDTKYDYGSGSKANRIRGFWNAESNRAVCKLLGDMMDYGQAEGLFQDNEYLLIECKKIVERLSSIGSGLDFDSLATKVVNFNFDTVQRDIERALQSADDDPEDAVTAACSLIESVCRSILIELSLPLPDKKDVEGLIRAVQEPLALSPARSDLPPEIAGDIKQILGGLTSVAKGVGALRTHAGDAHGRERGFARIDARVARLAIHSASTLALFLIETWEKKFMRRLPDRAG